MSSPVMGLIKRHHSATMLPAAELSEEPGRLRLKPACCANWWNGCSIPCGSNMGAKFIW